MHVHNMFRYAWKLDLRACTLTFIQTNRSPATPLDSTETLSPLISISQKIAGHTLVLSHRHIHCAVIEELHSTQ